MTTLTDFAVTLLLQPANLCVEERGLVVLKRRGHTFNVDVCCCCDLDGVDTHERELSYCLQSRRRRE